VSRNKELPKSINLLEPALEPEDFWTRAYRWILSIGRHMLVLVEVIVLIVFGIRFVIDKINNDLTKDINNKISTHLASPTQVRQESAFREYQKLLADVKRIQNSQVKNSERFSYVLDTIPTNLVLRSISFQGREVSLSMSADDFNDISAYTSKINSNDQFEDVVVDLSKDDKSQQDGAIQFNLSFKFVD